MRLTCPACNAEMSLDVLLGREADARAVAGLLELSLPFGALLLGYVALFRPPKRRLGLARMVGLVEELLPDIERQAVRRKGRDWPCPPELWRTGLQTVQTMRDKGTLTLPLTSHALLYEVLASAADKAEGKAEALREAARRDHRPAGAASAGPVAMAAAVPEMEAPAEERADPKVLERLKKARQAVFLKGLPMGGGPAAERPTTPEQA
jgi:hypothetical protein